MNKLKKILIGLLLIAFFMNISIDTSLDGDFVQFERSVKAASGVREDAYVIESNQGEISYGLSEGQIYLGPAKCTYDDKRTYLAEFYIFTSSSVTYMGYVSNLENYIYGNQFTNPFGNNNISYYSYRYRILSYPINFNPTITLNSPNETLTEINTATPSIMVSDPNGDELTCNYYIDDILKETKKISNTATEQLVTFSTPDVSAMTEGAHTFKYEVSDGVAEPVSESVNVIVDNKPPTIGNVTFTSEATSITFQGTATENISNPIAYRFSANNIVSDWTSNTSGTITGLIPNTSYDVKFEAKDSVGHIAKKADNICTKAQKPEVTVTSTNKQNIDISVSDSNPTSTEYQLMVGTSYVSQNGALSTSAKWITLTDKRISVTGLSSNTQYQIKAKARNALKEETGFSDLKAVTTLAQAPENISFTRAIDNLTISWNNVGGVTTGYDIEADGIVNNLGNVTTYIHRGLQAETTHTYRIRAKNASGNGEWSQMYSASTYPNPPITPEITSTEQFRTEVVLRFDAVAKATSYQIKADSDIVTIPSDGSTQYTYQHTKLQPETTHTYRIRAVNEGGASEWSEIEQVTTLPNPPEVPENIKCQPSRTDLTITWDITARADSYQVEIDGTIIDVTGDKYIHPGLTANTTHTYRVRGINRGGNGEWSELVSVSTWPEIPAAPDNIMASAEATNITMTWSNIPYAESYDIKIDEVEIVNIKQPTFEHKDLTPDSKHSYCIRANNISGSGEWSNVVNISTLPKEDEASADTSIRQQINAAAIVTNKTITLTWQQVTPDVQYELEVDGTLVENGNATTFTHTGLAPKSYHSYRIRTKDKNGYGAWVSTLLLSTLPDPPDMPTNVLASSTNNEIEISWTNVVGTEYQVEVDGVIVDVGSVGKYIDRDLEAGTSHTYRVRSVNVTGNSAWSNAIVKATNNPINQISCTKDKTFNYILTASNVKDFTKMRFVIKYDPDEVELVDLCEFTPKVDTKTGVIPDTNLTVDVKSGEFVYTVNESIVSGKTWSGEIATIVFRAKIDGNVSINLMSE